VFLFYEELPTAPGFRKFFIKNRFIMSKNYTVTEEEREILESVNLLLGKDGDPNQTRDDKKLFLAFQQASYNGHLEVVKVILDGGFDPNTTFYDNVTALLLAGQMGQLEIVRLLLDKGGDPNQAVTNYGRSTPLRMAAQNGHLEVVRLLLDRGVDPSQAPEPTFFRKVLFGYLEVIRYWLSMSPQEDAGKSKTPLFLAVERGRLEVVKLLLNRGVDLNKDIDAYNRSPLEISVIARNSDVTAYLINTIYENVNGNMAHFNERLGRGITNYTVELISDICSSTGESSPAALDLLMKVNEGVVSDLFDFRNPHHHSPLDVREWIKSGLAFNLSNISSVSMANYAQNLLRGYDFVGDESINDIPEYVRNELQSLKEKIQTANSPGRSEPTQYKGQKDGLFDNLVLEISQRAYQNAVAKKETSETATQIALNLYFHLHQNEDKLSHIFDSKVASLYQEGTYYARGEQVTYVPIQVAKILILANQKLKTSEHPTFLPGEISRDIAKEILVANSAKLESSRVNVKITPQYQLELGLTTEEALVATAVSSEILTAAGLHDVPNVEYRAVKNLMGSWLQEVIVPEKFALKYQEEHQGPERLLRDLEKVNYEGGVRAWLESFEDIYVNSLTTADKSKSTEEAQDIVQNIEEDEDSSQKTMETVVKILRAAKEILQSQEAAEVDSIAELRGLKSPPSPSTTNPLFSSSLGQGRDGGHNR
jgi:hypothetical protein